MGELDLRTLPAAELAVAGRTAYRESVWSEAIPLWHYAVRAGAAETYNLACAYALSGDAEAAFHWLLRAAELDGVDAEWATADQDLDLLLRDPRWTRVHAFLRAWNLHWATSGQRAVSLVVPTGYDKTTPIPVLVALHGLASQPDDFVDASWQPLADALHMAIVGVSGTVALGRHSYRWSEDVSRDAEQVRRALADLQTELKVQPGQLIAFGFSQGAQMAFEIAFANPSEYLGAVAMSPGVRKELDLERLPHADAQRARTYVCTGGAEEHPSNVANARADCAFAQKAGANVELKLYAGVSEHRFPQDFAQAFPQWIRRIAKTPVP